MDLLYFLKSWRSAEEAEWKSYGSGKLVALRNEYLEDMFKTHQSPTSELWLGRVTHISHKLGKQELKCMAQIQGAHVLTIKEAVLM